MSESGSMQVPMEAGEPTEDIVPTKAKPFSGMNKEELLKFSDTRLWNNIRLVCFVSSKRDFSPPFIASRR